MIFNLLWFKFLDSFGISAIVVTQIVLEGKGNGFSKNSQFIGKALSVTKSLTAKFLGKS